MRDLTTRLDEEVANATKSAKREAAKLRQRVRKNHAERATIVTHLSSLVPSYSDLDPRVGV